MRPQTKSMLKELRTYLRFHPESIAAYDVRYGIEKVRAVVDIPAPYEELLREANGCRFGEVVLCSDNELDVENQTLCAIYPSLGENWFVFGHVLYEPLVIDRGTQIVARVAELFVPPDRAGEVTSIATFDDFLEFYVLGNRYAQLSVEADVAHDAWWQLMGKLALR